MQAKTLNPFSFNPQPSPPVRPQAAPEALARVAPGASGRAPAPRQAARLRQAAPFAQRFLASDGKAACGAVEVAMLWRDDVIRVDQVPRGAGVSVGARADAHYLVEAATVGALHWLVRPQGRGWILSFKAEMQGFLLLRPLAAGATEKLSLTEAVTRGLARRGPDGYEVSLAAGTRARIDVGEVSFLVRLVATPALSLPLLSFGGSAGMSLFILLVGFALSFMLHGSFWIMVSLSTDRVDVLDIDRILSASGFAEALLAPESVEEEAEEKTVVDPEEEAGAVDEESGARAADAEGQAGRTDLESGEGAFGIEGQSDRIALAKAQDVQAAMGAGLLASAHEMSSLLGEGFQATGYDAVSAWGSFDSDAAIGNAPGTYGLGMKGAGRGGGGDLVGGFGIDRFGPGGPGRLGGGGGERGFGADAAHVPEKKASVPTLRSGPFKSTGTLDKRIIRKIVNQHRNEIRACYEKELTKKRGLHGKIEVMWVIDQSGNVSMAVVVSSTMDSREVEQCLERAIGFWRFPAPTGGALVQVTYPFVFEVSGS